MSLPLTPFSTLPTGFTAFTHDGVLLAYSPSTGEGMRWITHADERLAAQAYIDLV